MEESFAVTFKPKPDRVASYFEQLYREPLKSILSILCVIGAIQGIVRLAISLLSTASLIDVRIRVPRDSLELPQIAICHDRHDLPALLGLPQPLVNRDSDTDGSTKQLGNGSNVCAKALPRCYIHNNVNFNCCDYVNFVPSLDGNECFVFETLPFDGQQATPGSNAGFQVLVRLDHNQSQPENAIVAIAERMPKPFSLGSRSDLLIASVMPQKSYFFQLVANYERNCDEESACSLDCSELQRGNASETMDNDCGPNTCKTACSNWQYDLLVSYVNLELQKVEDLIYLDSNDTGVSPPPSYALVRVFYSTLFYLERIQIQPVTGHTVISQVGGVIAIWLGASVMGAGRRVLDWLAAWKVGLKVVRKGVGIT